MTQSPAASPTSRRGLVDIGVLIGFVAVCLLVGYLGSVATTPNLAPWYAGLAKPSWTPPPVVFPIAWTILYVAMAVAAWLVWRSRDRPSPRGGALVAFAVQLALNAAWSWAFFAAQSPGLGLIVIAALVIALGWTIRAFARLSAIAALLLAPYFLWVCFAGVLNAAIFAMNA